MQYCNIIAILMPFPPEHSFLFWYLLDPQTFFLSLAWYIYSCTPNSWQFLYFYSNSGISRSHNVCHLSPSASRSHCINVHNFLGLALVLNPVSLESPPETMSVSIQTYIWPLASNTSYIFSLNSCWFLIARMHASSSMSFFPVINCDSWF